MDESTTVSFENLVTYRQELQDFCSAHHRSLSAFRDGISFKLSLDEPALAPGAQHLSSSATCIESLLECPHDEGPRKEVSTLAKDFAVAAMLRPGTEWLSGGSAPVYCRCRTLPLLIYHLPTYQTEIDQHLEAVLDQLKRDVSRLAIGE